MQNTCFYKVDQNYTLLQNKSGGGGGGAGGAGRPSPPPIYILYIVGKGIYRRYDSC